MSENLFTNIFLCKDPEEFKARVTRFAFASFECKKYYEMGGDWLHFEGEGKLLAKIIRLMLKVQDSIISSLDTVIDMFDCIYTKVSDDFSGFLEMLSLLCDERYKLRRLQEFYHNGYFDDEGKPREQVTVADIKKWLRINAI